MTNLTNSLELVDGYLEYIQPSLTQVDAHTGLEARTNAWPVLLTFALHNGNGITMRVFLIT